MNAVQQIVLSAAVQLAKYIVKQKNRCIIYLSLYNLNLRKL